MVMPSFEKRVRALEGLRAISSPLRENLILEATGVFSSINNQAIRRCVSCGTIHEEWALSGDRGL
jgi:hypothetical protein